MSEPPKVPPEVVAAVLEVRKKMKSLVKEDTNRHGGYNYVSIDSYYEGILPVTNEAGLIWRTREVAYDLVEGQGGTKNHTYVRARFIYDLFKGGAAAMDYMAVTIFAPVAGAQTTGQLFSYADKVFMRVAFGVPTGEKDADDNAPEQVTSVRPPQGMTLSLADPVNPPPSTPQIAGTLARQAVSPPLPPHDLQTGEIKAAAPATERAAGEAKIAPKQTKEGLPIVDTREVNKDAVDMIFQIFQKFMPTVRTSSQLLDFHAENLAAIEKVKTIDPSKHDAIKGLFNERHAKLKPKA